MSKEEQVLVGFRELFNKMAWLNKVKMEESLKGFKAAEVHYIECIGKNDDSNVTQLAESLYMTRGAISKMTRKLIEKGIIESYQKPDNKKEIYFRLTSYGKEVYTIHDTLHKQFQQRDQVVFDQITAEQFDSMLQFIENYKKHLDGEIKKQEVELKSQEN